MMIAIDIETVGNPEAVALMPTPEVKTGNTKDPAKIAEKVAEAKREMFEKAALDPLTARVVCYSMVGLVNPGPEGQQEHVDIVQSLDDAAERTLLQSILRVLGGEDVRIVTWNGIGFDLPMIYKRAMILGADPANFGAPPLTAWTAKYKTDRHYDLMQIWGGWRDYVKLDTVARMVLGSRKTEFDVTTIADLIATPEGRGKVAEYCLQDTRLTWGLFQKFTGFLFA